MAAKQDLLDELLARARKRAVPLTLEDLVALVREMRRDYGGREVYVLKKTADVKAQELGQAVASGTSVTDVSKNTGVPRRTTHRLLKRRFVTDW